MKRVKIELMETSKNYHRQKNRIFRTSIILIALAVYISGCDEMKTEIEINSAAFPPRFCVTAILNGADSILTVELSEGRALADYKTPVDERREIIVRNGAIRLYQDGVLIMTKSGKFDMSNAQSYSSHMKSRGYRFDTAVAAKPGSVYRLEVEDMDGNYSKAVATSHMPSVPDVRASVDSYKPEKKINIKSYSSLQGITNTDDSHFDTNVYFYSFQLEWGERDAERNYYAVEMWGIYTYPEETTVKEYNGYRYNMGVFVADLSKLRDNPEVEIFEEVEIDLNGGNSSRPVDLYHFPILLMSDAGFTGDDSSLRLYMEDFPSSLKSAFYPEYNYSVVLRIRHITGESFKYYRSVAQQGVGIDFFTEPVNVSGNVNNGYGCFTVFSARDITLLEYSNSFYH